YAVAQIGTESCRGRYGFVHCTGVHTRCGRAHFGRLGGVCDYYIGCHFPSVGHSVGG
ncbi:unnamed protein product, partial [Lampetra planeri]